MYDKHLTFDAPYESEVLESSKVHVYLYEPDEVLYDIIFLHGIGNGNIEYLMWFGDALKEEGIRVSFMILPYHRERAPKGWHGGEPFYTTSPFVCRRHFHNAVLDVSKTLDIVENLPKYDPERVGIIGISFGGMIATIALAKEKRLKKGILCCTGGDWRWINWHSPYTEDLRRKYAEEGNEYGCRSEKQCVSLRKNALDVVESFREIKDIFEKAPVACYHYDPLSFAKFVEQPVLFIEAVFDRVIPRASRKELKRLLRYKEVVHVPSGHKGFYFFRKWLVKKIKRFLLKDRRS